MSAAIKSDRSQAILRAAIEAGAIRKDEITIVIVVDRNAALDIATVAPSAAAANLIPFALMKALDATAGSEAALAERIEVAKS